MFYQKNIYLFEGNSQWGASIIYLNVYIYILLLYIFFSLIFLYDFKKIRSLNNLKIFYKHNFSCITAILIILSLAGIPPLLGFVGKFLLFLFLFFAQKYIYILVFSFLNFFSIYFYIQNLRFLISKTQTQPLLRVGFYTTLNNHLLSSVVLFNIINLFGILFVEDFLFFFTNLTLYKLV